MHFGDGSLFGENSFSWIAEPRDDASNNNNNNKGGDNNNSNHNADGDNNATRIDLSVDDGEDDVDDDGDEDDDDDEEDDFDNLDEIDFDDVAQGNDSRMPSDVTAMLRSILQQRAEHNANASANLANLNAALNSSSANSANAAGSAAAAAGTAGAATASVAPSRIERVSLFAPSDSRPAPSGASEAGSTILRKFVVPPSLSAVSTPHAGRFVCPVCGPQGVSGPVQGVIGDHIGADEVRSLNDMGLIYTEATLVAHFLHDHQEARTSMVCPICASRPDGIADYATSNIARHMMLRHRPTIGAFGALRDSRVPTSVRARKNAKYAPILTRLFSCAQMRPRLTSLMGMDPTRMMEEHMQMVSGSGGVSAPSGAENGFGAASLTGVKRLAKPSAAPSPDAVTADSLNVDLSSELDSGLAGPVLSKSTVQRDVKRAKFVQELVLSTLI